MSTELTDAILAMDEDGALEQVCVYTGADGWGRDAAAASRWPPTGPRGVDGLREET